MMKHLDGFVSLKHHQKMMIKRGLTFRETERKIFKSGLTPLRFKRNQISISQKEQYTLFKSHVAIVGCGGLGGNVAELLARIGVGKLTLIDSDTYTEHNLNRQNFSTIKTIGKSKVHVVSKNLSHINPALHVRKKVKLLDEKNIHKLLKNADIVIDCLDNPKTKLLLSSWCEKNHKKFIHGAIGGKSLQVTTSKNLKTFYKSDKSGVEKIYGNLSFTASNCASLQTALCIKMLLDKDFSLDDVLFCDLNDFEFINLPIIPKYVRKKCKL